MVPSFSSYVSRQSVLRPRRLVKPCEQEILRRDKDFDLVAKVLLEYLAAPSQRRAEFSAHLLAIPARPGLHRDDVAEVMPPAQADRPLVLVLESTAVLRDVLDRGVHIQVAHQQTRQAAAMLCDGIHALAVSRIGLPGFAYQWSTAGQQTSS